MRVTESSRKHGFADDEILHAFENAIRYVEYEYGGEDRQAYCSNWSPSRSTDRCGSSTPTVRLRSKFYDYLR